MSTRPVAPDHIPEGWQEINRITNRLAVPGGWIYEVRNAGVVFVPEPLDASSPRLGGTYALDDASVATAVGGNLFGRGAEIIS
jgi:hypothetical protein